MDRHPDDSCISPTIGHQDRDTHTSNAGHIVSRDDLLEGVVDRLERWERFGGVWTVLARSADGITFSLRRCDGGEEQQRLTSADPSVAIWLDERQTISQNP